MGRAEGGVGSLSYRHRHPQRSSFTTEPGPAITGGVTVPLMSAFNFNEVNLPLKALYAHKHMI